MVQLCIMRMKGLFVDPRTAGEEACSGYQKEVKENDAYISMISM